MTDFRSPDKIRISGAGLCLEGRLRWNSRASPPLSHGCDGHGDKPRFLSSRLRHKFATTWPARSMGPLLLPIHILLREFLSVLWNCNSSHAVELSFTTLHVELLVTSPVLQAPNYFQYTHIGCMAHKKIIPI